MPEESAQSTRQTQEETLGAAVAEAVSDPETAAEVDDRIGNVQRELTRTLIGGVFILNSYLANWVYRDSDMPGEVSAAVGALLLGVPLIMRGWRDLRSGVMSMNELASLAVLASFAIRDYRVAGIVSFFMLLGNIVESRTALGARASIASLVRLTPTSARRLRKDGSEEEVTVSDLALGDRVRIRPGDNIPADGTVLSGQAAVNQATITGESLPADKQPGDEVFAGTQSLTGVLEVEVTRVGGETTLGRVRELILAAEQTKLPLMRMIDRYVGFYTPTILMIAALVWFFSQEVPRVIAIFVVACPGALILAAPTAVVAALSAGARLGILFKNVADIEAAASLNAAVFDKTGTLTTGQLGVSRLSPTAGVEPAELLRLVASAEQYSNHPAARAMVALSQEARVTLAEPAEFKETAGRGVGARVDGHHVLAGNLEWMHDNEVDLVSAGVDLTEAEGFSLIFVARDQRCLGWVALQDQVREDAREALRDLKHDGMLRIAMVTGDRESVARRVSKEVGCDDVRADCLPQTKVEFVEQFKQKGYSVAVVGDGVNDAPALAAGDIGIAMGAAGSDVAIHSATIALMNNNLKLVPFLIRLSRRTRAIINQKFAIGILFIVGGLVLSSLGWLSPVVAVVLHNVGSLAVAFNSARLVREGEGMQPHTAPLTLPQAPAMTAQAQSALGAR